MLRTCLGIVLLICGLVGRGVADERPEFVGMLGAPERIIFNGAQTFSQMELRRAVAFDMSQLLVDQADEALDLFRIAFSNKSFPDMSRLGFPTRRFTSITTN